MRGTRRSFAVAVAGVLSAITARASAQGRGAVIVSAERVLPIATVSHENRDVYPRTTTQLGLGPLLEPNSIHEVPRIAIDVVITERLTLGASPIFSFTAAPAGYDRFALGLAPRVGWLFPLSKSIAFWPHAGPAYAYVNDGTKGSQLMVSGELPFVWTVADGAAITLGVSGGAPITAEDRAGKGSTNLDTSYAGLNGGLTAWFGGSEDRSPLAEEKPRAPNEDLRNGIVISAERLVPLVTHHEGQSFVTFNDGTTCGYGASLCAREVPGDVTFGFEAGAIRSLFDLPGVAVDGAIAGFTLGAGARVGATGGKRVDQGFYDGFVRTKSAVAVMPRAGYVLPVGGSFALWPRVGAVLLAQAEQNDAVVFPFATLDLAAALFAARHVAFTLTPSAQLPLSEDDGDPYATLFVRRLGLDAGLLLAF